MYQAGFGGTSNAPSWQQAAMGGGLMSMLGGFGNMMDYQDPSQSAMPYMNQISGQMQNTLGPYAGAGMSAVPGMNAYSQFGQAQIPIMQALQQKFGQMSANPGQFMNQMGQNFQQSPGYQFQVNQATGAANRAAAAGGMLGSPQEQQTLGTTVNGLANQDYYNWMDHAMNVLGQGLSGQSQMSQGLYNTGGNMMQNLFGTGAGAAGNLSDSLAQALMSQANLAYAGQSNQNQNQGGSMGSMMGGLGSFIMGL